MAGGTVVILMLLGLAYSSQVRAFPHERGDYGVVRDRLGQRFGMITGASLLIDYLFTVSISVAAIAEALIYLLPSWDGWAPVIAVIALGLMTLVNLRGIRDRGRVLLAVWHGFVLVLVVLFVVGWARHDGTPTAPLDTGSPEVWSILVAFAGAVASGAVMATGIEHLAASGPYHAEPRGKRASRTLLVAVIAGAGAFYGVAWLAWAYRLSGWADGPMFLQVSRARVRQRRRARGSSECPRSRFCTRPRPRSSGDSRASRVSSHPTGSFRGKWR